MKLNPEIYRKAAEEIFLGEHDNITDAIILLNRYKNGRRVLYYDRHVTYILAYFDIGNNHNLFGGGLEPENQNHRITALLLMAEIAEDL